MQLSAGTRLGPYEIVSPIGAGGMGEVYRALDTRLNREVAVKVSAERFTERFEREARAIASLNHPNICTLFDVGPNYLVMEYIEGESPKGPLPLDTVLDYARQMADALDAAHEKGITHRDLKPGNLKITPDGKLKILDFGLAKVGGVTQTSGSAENSPTLTIGMTEVGMILGTAAYMAPEQAKGKIVDKRADIWAYGVVLFELSTGIRMFKGEDVSDVLASVLKEQPQLDLAPERLRPLLRRCLEKDPKKRLRDIADAAVLLEPQAAAVTAQAPPKPSKWPLAVAALALLSAAGFGGLHFTETTPALPHLRFTVAPPEGVTFAGSNPRIAISPDGTQIAFNATQDGKTQMWVRRLDSGDARPLPGSEGSETPFWSPDSRSVGVFVAGKLKRIDVTSGAVQVLCDAPVTDAGGTWSPDGQTILFSGRNPDISIQRVAATGGTPVSVLKLRPNEANQRWPRFLPDGKHFLYLSTAAQKTGDGIFVASLDGGESKLLLNSSFAAEFADGFLFYRTDEALLARAFDPAKLEFTGEAVQVFPAVTALANGRISASVSTNGYLIAQESRGAEGSNMLLWLDRTGKELSTVGEPGTYRNIALSPDGRQLAVGRVVGSEFPDIWLIDLARNVPTRLPFDKATEQNPIWSLDGRSVLFSSDRNGKAEIYSKPATGLGEEQLLLSADRNAIPNGFSPDGKLLLYSFGAGSTRNMMAQDLSSKGPAIPVLTTPFDEAEARFSPDGHWIAYSSDESGMPQVYIRSFPGTERKIQISTNGGVAPIWRRDGKELFFLGGDAKLMVAPIKSLSPLEPGTPVALFQTQFAFVVQRRVYDVSSDGSRFIVNSPQTTATQAPLTVIQNWKALLQK